ncbi:hypothetical protein JKP88DRAFT_349881 [Tribonema minus]|uniref:Protein MON2 homolog n=1 Tax=Tribonema minus TaxID=303371 RepID=A0A835YQS4_9STRA|nr:hypothetical protein JKP88DRAFT_349881 [Tribonema minus]
MEFLRVIEGELQGLSGEAKRKYPEVTEASERAILRLRGMREQYATALRRSGGEAPPLSMFRSQDLLRPFLLACNHSDAPAKLIGMALGSVQHLINRDAVSPADAPNVMRVLAIQAASAQPDVQLRVLQTLVMVVTWHGCEMSEETTLVMVVTWRGCEMLEETVAHCQLPQTLVMVVTWRGCEMSEETVAQALGVCLALHEAKNTTVRRAAYMTVRQIVSLLFDRVDDQVTAAAAAAAAAGAEGGGAQGVGRGGDRGAAGALLKHTNITRALGLELIEQALAAHPGLFKPPAGPYSELVTLEMLKGRVDLPLLVRLLRLAATVVVDHGETLLPQCEVILLLLLHYVNGGQGHGGHVHAALQGSDAETGGSGPINLATGGRETPWTAMLALELYAAARHVCAAAAAATAALALRRILSVSLWLLRFYDSFELAGRGRSPTVVSLLGRITASSDVLRRILSVPPLLLRFYESFDLVGRGRSPGRGGASPVVGSLVYSLSHFLLSHCSSHPGQSAGAMEMASSEQLAKGGQLGGKGLTELLPETEPPPLADRHPLLEALLCVLDLAAALSALAGGALGVENRARALLLVPPPPCDSSAQQPPPPGGAQEPPPGNAQLPPPGSAQEQPPPPGSAQQLPPPGGAEQIDTERPPSDVMSAAQSRGALREMVEGCWGGILAGVSHGLGHLQAPLVLEPTLLAAERMAIACGLMGIEQGMYAYMTCLCRLALPSWHSSGNSGGGGGGGAAASAASAAAAGGGGGGPVLSHRHVCALATLLRLMHRLGDLLGSGAWHSSLDVIDQLDGTAVAGEGCEAAAAALRAAAGRFVGFSQALRGPALHAAMLALASLSAGALAQDASPAAQGGRGGGREREHTRALSSSGIASMAAAQSQQNAPVCTVRIADPLQQWLGSKSGSSFGEAGFATACVVACAHANSHRLGTIWDVVAGHLKTLAAINSKPLRDASVRALSDLLVQALLNGSSSAPKGPATRRASSGGRDELNLDWVFVVDLPAAAAPPEHDDDKARLQALLFDAVAQLAQTPYIDTREATLSALHNSCGQVVDRAWGSILSLLTAVAQASHQLHHPGAGSCSGGAGAGQQWGGSCLALAFTSLKLIVDDFLDRVPPVEVPTLVRCTGTFAAQVENVNLSLTAVGMLWTVSDAFTSTNTRQVGKVDMWSAMLTELSHLAKDQRPEVRNCAINTLFSALIGNGSTFSDQQWQQYLLEVTFPLLGEVLCCTRAASHDTGVAPELRKGVRAVMHHSRDTDRKQWSETSVLAMQGLGRLMRSFARVLGGRPWFVAVVWPQTLAVFRDACLLGAAEQEVALAGVDGLSTLVQLMGRDGLSAAQARVSADMSVVRVSAGMSVVNGALQRSPAAPPPEPLQSGDGEGFEEQREGLWAQAWRAMRDATSFESDEFGEVAAAFARAYTQVHRSGAAAEFAAANGSSAQHDGSAAVELLDALDSLMVPRRAQPLRDGDGPTAGGQLRRTGTGGHTLTTAQRLILEFIKDEVCGCWDRAVRLLANYAFGPAGVSEACAREAAQVLISLMGGRVPAEARAAALPGLLTHMSRPCEALLRPEMGRAASVRAAGQPIQVWTHWPAAPRYVALLSQFRMLLVTGLQQGAPSQLAAWGVATDSLRSFGVPWAQGLLAGEPGGDGSGGAEYASQCLISLGHITAGVKHACMAGNEPRRALTLGGAVFPGPFSDAQFGRCRLEQHVADRSGAVSPAYNTLRCCRAVLLWFADIDAVLAEDVSDLAPLSAAEERCLLALAAIGQLHAAALAQDDEEPEGMLDAVAAMVEGDYEAADGSSDDASPPDAAFQNEPSAPASQQQQQRSRSNSPPPSKGDARALLQQQHRRSSGGSTAAFRHVEGARGYLVVMCPLLLRALATRSRPVREAAASLLSTADIPGTIRGLQLQVEAMAATIARLRGERDELRSKQLADSFF